MDPVRHPGVLIVVEGVLIIDKIVMVGVAYIGIIPYRHLNAGNDLTPVELVSHSAVKAILLQELLHLVHRHEGIRVDNYGAELPCG